MMRRILKNVWGMGRWVCLALGMSFWGIGCIGSAIGQTAPVPPSLPKPPSFDFSKPSPVQTFRELLAMSQGQRQEYFEGKSASQRQRIIEGIKEFEQLSEEDRTTRLAQMDLRWYLLPAMKLPMAERNDAVNRVPEYLQDTLKERLALWSILPPPLQQEVFQYSSTLQYFVRLERSSPPEREALWQSLPSDQRPLLREKLDQWQALPEGERAQIQARVERFLDWTPEERVKSISQLPNEDREAVNRVLLGLKDLSKPQQDRCLEGLKKFSSLTPAQKSHFIQTATHWQKMSTEERDAWRKLAVTIPTPPMPVLAPGFPSNSRNLP